MFKKMFKGSLKGSLKGSQVRLAAPMGAGGWGGALMDEEHWHLVYAIVRHAAASPELRIPVTCKIRIFAAWWKQLATGTTNVH